MVERGELDFQPEWLATEVFDQIASACQRCGTERLKPIKGSAPRGNHVRADSPSCGADEAGFSGIARMSE
jgi:hypothetical protein